MGKLAIGGLGNMSEADQADMLKRLFGDPPREVPPVAPETLTVIEESIVRLPIPDPSKGTMQYEWLMDHHEAMERHRSKQKVLAIHNAKYRQVTRFEHTMLNRIRAHFDNERYLSEWEDATKLSYVALV